MKRKPTHVVRQALIVVLFFTVAFMAPAYAGRGQLLKDTRVTVAISSGSLEAAVKTLQQHTKITFAYDRQLLRSYAVQKCAFNNEALEQVLNKLFNNTTLECTEVNQILVISQHTASKAVESPQGRQEIIISGTVTDETGQPMPGVAVAVKGNPTMTATDANGRYKLIVSSPAAVLSFSYIGYETSEVTVGSQTNIAVQLQRNSKALGEVAVVGFSTQRRISLVGAQSSIRPAELKQPASDITSMLAGRIAGVVGVQRSGEPGRGSADIWIRGISTFGGGNNSHPLILVDGVERSINSISPEDIESFTVLKDAAGTAVYGVRGANGVIIVKTKTGKMGKPQINLDYQEGQNTFTRRPKMLDGVTYMQLANEALTTRNHNPIYSDDYIEKTKDKTDPLLYPNVDWMDAVFNKHGHMRQANLNASGGVENAQYYVSLNYYNESGFLKTDDLQKYNSSLAYNRYNFTTNLNLKVTKTTKVDVGVQGWFSNGNYPGIATGDIFQSAMDAAPVAYPIMYPGGLVPGQSSNGGFRNPYADLTRRGYRNEFKNQVYSNVRATQDLDMITPGLTATAMFSFDTYNQNFIIRSRREDTYYPDMSKPYNDDGSLNLIKTFSGDQFLGFDRDDNDRQTTRQFYTEAALNYNRTFGKHTVSGLALFYSNDRTNALANDFITSIPERYLGWAGKGTYSYNDRYFAEFNFGYNGSELFAPQNRFGFFPAVGIGWVVSNEKFFQPISHVVNFLKFRYSNGNSGLGSTGERFLYITKLGQDGNQGYTFGDTKDKIGGIYIDRYQTNVKWSVSNKQDLGMELHTLNDQLNINIDLFKEHRTGIFLPRASNVIYMGLQNQQYGNLGIVDNQGVDANLEYNTHIGAVGLQLRGNLTLNHDKLREDDTPPQAYPWMNHRGNNVNARYGYIAEGLFSSDDEIAKSAVPGDRSAVKAGDIKYKDLNGDGLINNYDVTKIGHGDVPTLTYGFGFTVDYKGFSFGTLFEAVHNADVYLGGDAIIPFNGGGGLTNAYAIATDRWTTDNPNPHAFYPRLAYGEAENKNNTQTSSWWVKDISFMRLKSAQLAYNLPSSFLKKTKLRGASIYLNGINLITFSNFKLWDPEINTQNGLANGASYPNVKTVAAGINVKF